MAQTYTYTKQIGNSRFLVNVRFDETATDTYEDKLLKVIAQDAAAKVETNLPQDSNSNQPINQEKT